MSNGEEILLAGILHNLKNYLQTIVGTASLGLNSSFEESTTKSHFKVILSAAVKSSETIKQMTVLKSYPGKNTGPFDAYASVSEIIEIFKPVSNNKIFISCLSEDVPFMFGNKSDISQILLNLFLNARDAITENGEIAIRIYYANQIVKPCDSTNYPRDYVCISVKDNGSGIPEDIRKTLFTEVITTKRETINNGIGLVISRILAERNDGWIECVPSDNNGAEFLLYFPAYDETIIEYKKYGEQINESTISTRK